MKLCRSALATVFNCEMLSRDTILPWNIIAATVIHGKCPREMGSLRQYWGRWGKQTCSALLDLYIYIELKTLSASCRRRLIWYWYMICVSFHWHDWNRPNSGSLINQTNKQTNKQFCCKVNKLVLFNRFSRGGGVTGGCVRACAPQTFRHFSPENHRKQQNR